MEFERSSNPRQRRAAEVIEEGGDLKATTSEASTWGRCRSRDHFQFRAGNFAFRRSTSQRYQLVPTPQRNQRRDGRQMGGGMVRKQEGVDEVDESRPIGMQAVIKSPVITSALVDHALR